MEKLNHFLFSFVTLFRIRKGIPGPSQTRGVIIAYQFTTGVLCAIAAGLIFWLLPCPSRSLPSCFFPTILSTAAALAILHFIGGFQVVIGTKKLLEQIFEKNRNGQFSEITELLNACTPFLSLLLFPVLLYILIYSHCLLWLPALLVLSASGTGEILQHTNLPSKNALPSADTWLIPAALTLLTGLFICKVQGNPSALSIALVEIAASILGTTFLQQAKFYKPTWGTTSLIFHIILFVLLFIINSL